MLRTSHRIGSGYLLEGVVVGAEGLPWVISGLFRHSIAMSAKSRINRFIQSAKIICSLSHKPLHY